MQSNINVYKRMRQLTFSRVYPWYHLEKGNPTFFAEKIWCNPEIVPVNIDFIINYHSFSEFPKWIQEITIPKQHTIRENFNWKKGDWFKPVYWSGRPYHSKPIAFAEPTEVKRTYNFSIRNNNYYLKEKKLSLKSLEELAVNDGLTCDNFELWFGKVKSFEGQVIVYTDITY